MAVAATPGQARDLAPAAAPLGGRAARHVLADRAHDARSLRDPIVAPGAEPVVPPNPARKHPADHDRLRHRERDRIERLVGRLKRFRRIAARHGRRAAYFLAAVHLVASLEWLT